MLASSPVTPMLPVVDLDRARDFYENTLGLSPMTYDSATGTIIYRCGQGTTLGIYQRATPTTADHTAASWRVSDINEAVETLRANGIQFEQYDLPGLKTDARGIAVVGEEQAAWFRDPEGNILAIAQY